MFADYIMGCYSDEYPPYILSGAMELFSSDNSVAKCVKTCGEAGFLLAGLRDRFAETQRHN